MDNKLIAVNNYIINFIAGTCFLFAVFLAMAGCGVKCLIREKKDIDDMWNYK